jgi:hypothetical protein
MKIDAIPSGFTFKDILPGRNVIACGATHPVANRTSVTAVRHCPLSVDRAADRQPALRGFAQRAFEHRHARLSVSFSGGTLTSIINILERSDALTVLPYSVVFTLRRQKMLVGAIDQDRPSGTKPGADVEPGAERTTVGQALSPFHRRRVLEPAHNDHETRTEQPVAALIRTVSAFRSMPSGCRAGCRPQASGHFGRWNSPLLNAVTGGNAGSCLRP